MRKKSTAVEVKPMTVAERRRVLRAAKEPASGPGLKRAVIDLTKPDARKVLQGLFPRPESETLIDATPELEAAALQYIEARDAESLAKKKKDVAGNVICNAIGKNLGIVGDGWRATWDMTKGNVDWAALAKDLAIPDETIAKYRKPEYRGLDVKETAEEA